MLPPLGRRPGLIASALLLVALATLMKGPGPASAQTRSSAVEEAGPSGDVGPELERLARALRDAQRTHLRRVGLWGGANLVGGAVLAATSDAGSFGRAFGVQSAGWGAVNVGLAAVGLLADPGPVPGDVPSVLAAEDGWTHLLLVNLGLNVGYTLVGSTLLVAAGEGLEGPTTVRGHGAAVVVQGLGLLVLDALAWLDSRDRSEQLRSRLPLTLSAGPRPGSARLTLLSVGVGP